jgi:acyl carrier protein
MDNIKRDLRLHIEDNFLLGTGGRPLADADSFLEYRVLDSTGFLELVTHLEQTYGIRVGDDEMVPENLDSLDAVAAYVTRKLSAAREG